MGTHDTISLVIPVYNGRDYIDQCLDAALAQKELSEVICIDAGSSDGSYDLLLEKSQEIDRIKVIKSPKDKRLNAAAARNLGIQSANCAWIAFCDVDDYFLEKRFETFAKAEKEGISIFHTAVLSAYEKDNLKPSIQEVTICPHNYDDPRDMQHHLIGQSEESISIIGTIILKEVLLENPFDENLDIGEDTDLLWRLSGLHHFRYEDLQPPRVVRRVHDTNSYQNKERLIKGRLKFYEKWKGSKEYETLRPEAQKRIREGRRHYKYVEGYEFGKTFFQSGNLLRHVVSKVLKT